MNCLNKKTVSQKMKFNFTLFAIFLTQKFHILKIFRKINCFLVILDQNRNPTEI